MSDTHHVSLWQRFLDMPNESPGKTIAVAGLVALASALIVSMSSVLLRPIQLKNIATLRQHQMATMLSQLPGLESVFEQTKVDELITRMLDLNEARYTDKVKADSYDQRKAATDPAISTELPDQYDIAGLSRRANFAPVYLLHNQGHLSLVILPVHGVGYQSTIYAWLVLSADQEQIVALTIYEQGETPGLGAKIEEDAWQAQWAGKQLRNESGDLIARVVKGRATSEYEIDGISGATRTGNSINNLLEFWLGDYGYGPYLKKLLAGELS